MALSRRMYLSRADVGFDKSQAVSTDALLARSSEDNGDDLCGDGEESVSGRCESPAIVRLQALVKVVMTPCVINSRYISAQGQSSCWSNTSSSVHPVAL